MGSPEGRTRRSRFEPSVENYGGGFRSIGPFSLMSWDLVFHLQEAWCDRNRQFCETLKKRTSTGYDPFAVDFCLWTNLQGLQLGPRWTLGGLNTFP